MSNLWIHLPGFLQAITFSSLCASGLALVVLVLQFALSRHLPARYRFALWFLVLIRLTALPLPTSPFSILNLLDNHAAAPRQPEDASNALVLSPEPAVPAIPPAPVATPSNLAESAASPSAAVSMHQDIATVKASVPAGSSVPNPSKDPLAVATPLPWPWLPIAIAVYVAGVALIALRHLVATLTLRGIIRAAEPLHDPQCQASLQTACATLGIQVRLPLLVTDTLSSPAVVGLFRPRLLIPRTLASSLGPLDLHFVFLHECAHLSRHDILLNCWLAILSAIHWFNPLVWLMMPRIRADRELACDELVLLYTPDPSRYGHTLLKILESSMSMPRFSTVVGIVESRSFFTRRIRMIAQFRKSPLWLALPSFAAFGLLAAITLTNGAEAANPVVPESPLTPPAGEVPQPPKVAVVPAAVTQLALGPTAAPATPTPATSSDSKNTPTDMSALKTISLDAAAWTYAPAGVNLKLTTGAIQLPGENGNDIQGHHDFDTVIPGGQGVVAIQYNLGSEFQGAKHLEHWGVGLVDLKTGAAFGIARFPTDYNAKGIVSDGSLAVISGKSAFDPESAEIKIVELKGDAAPVKWTFVPYEGESQDHRAVTWTRLVDKTHLLTLNNERRLIFWELGGDSIKGIWSLAMPARIPGDPLLTPDCKYVVIVDERGTFLLDAATGAVAGAIDDAVASGWFANVGLQNAVSPDGKMLARATNPRVKVYSLAANGSKLVGDIFMPPKTKIETVAWISDDYLLINRAYLIDVPKGLIVWKYSGLGGGAFDHSVLLPGDGRMWLVTGQQSKVNVRSFVMPGEDVKKVVVGLDLDKIMAVKPGLKVTLDIAIPDTTVAASVKSHFEEQLQKNNMTLADDQPIKLRVSIADANSRDVQYRNPPGRASARPAARTSDVKVTTKQMTVAYEVDGKDLWNVVLYSGAPLLLKIAPGQSIDGAIKAKQAGDWVQLQSVELPKYVPALRDPPGFGQTAMDVEHKP